MLHAGQATKAGNSLIDLIKAKNGKLSTGFLGVKPLLPALSATGHSNEAHKLLVSMEYPSWGFEVVNGVNTIWGCWNSYVKGKGFGNNAGMNSLNHYAFGSVNEWLFENAAGKDRLTRLPDVYCPARGGRNWYQLGKSHLSFHKWPAFFRLEKDRQINRADCYGTRQHEGNSVYFSQ